MPTKRTEPPKNGRPSARPRQRSHRSTISLPARLREALEKRGARSDKSHGPYNYTRQLTRTLELYGAVIEKSDPRQTRALPKAHYELVVEVLTDALDLETFHIHLLGDYLCELPAFVARIRDLELDAQDLRDVINAYTFAEKLHLVDAALVRHAPPSPPGEPA